jgi:hypothetical protein
VYINYKEIDAMTTIIRLKRRSPNSANDFDLVSINPEDMDFDRMNELLTGILGESHRGLTLSSRATKEFQRWFNHPETPLKSDAYVLLSNWFMTQSGDRHSLVASRCEALWDTLFPIRPAERLSSPKPGQNHVMIPTEFESFWRRVLEAQGEGISEVDGGPAKSDVKLQVQNSDSPQASNGATPAVLRAMFEKEGLHVEVQGSPNALAEFLRIVSNWEVS